MQVIFAKGICPELELHGTDASVSINRVTGDVILGMPEGNPEMIASIPDEGMGNRFEKFVFPAVRNVIAGKSQAEHPDLEAGWRVQCFTDAVVQSAETGGWVNVGR